MRCLRFLASVLKLSEYAFLPIRAASTQHHQSRIERLIYLAAPSFPVDAGRCGGREGDTSLAQLHSHVFPPLLRVLYL